MESHPFFALLLMYLKFVAVPSMKKMSTNGRCIYFAPDFVEALDAMDFTNSGKAVARTLVVSLLDAPVDLAMEAITSLDNKSFKFMSIILLSNYSLAFSNAQKSQGSSRFAANASSTVPS